MLCPLLELQVWVIVPGLNAWFPSFKVLRKRCGDAYSVVCEDEGWMKEERQAGCLGKNDGRGEGDERTVRTTLHSFILIN